MNQKIYMQLTVHFEIKAHYIAGNSNWLAATDGCSQNGLYDIAPDAQDALFYDKASGTSLNLGSIIASFDTRRRFMSGADYLTGGSGDDKLIVNIPRSAGTDALSTGADYMQMSGDIIDGGAVEPRLWLIEQALSCTLTPNVLQFAYLRQMHIYVKYQY